MLRFAHFDMLYGWLAIPVFVILFIFARRITKNALKRFGDAHLMVRLIPDVSGSRPIFKFVLLMLAYIFLIAGLAGPQLGSKLEDIKREGVELIIALDVSNSMMAEDIQPNRLERAKRAIDKLIERLHSDKIGLIVFAGDAYSQLPITTDYSAAKMFLSAVNTSIVPVQGTAIGAAIEMAMESFSPENDKNKAIIIITDGENHEDDAIAMAKKATEKGITVHTIGMGLPKGAPIPVKLRYGQTDYRRDKDGQIIISRLDEVMLQEIATTGNGVYIRANNSKVGLNTLFDELNKMEKEEYEAAVYADYEDRFQYLIAVALFFLLFDFVVLRRKNRILKNVNIFNKTI